MISRLVHPGRSSAIAADAIVLPGGAWFGPPVPKALMGKAVRDVIEISGDEIEITAIN